MPTYLSRSVGKQVANHFIPGSGDFLSSATADLKDKMLSEIQQKFFQSSANYSGGDIGLNDALKAIQYVRSKKHTKSVRTATKGGIKFAGFVAGAVTGATLGSIIPVAGTIGGGVAGGVGAGVLVSGGVTGLDQIKQKTKGIYKFLRGTRGEHRSQAASTLLHCQASLPDGDPKSDASHEALIVILGDEYEEVMAMPAQKAHDRIADRLKSN